MSYTHTPPWVLKMAMARRRGRGWGWGPDGGFPMGPGRPFRSRAKAGRGDVRLAVLHLLAEEPMHGYQIMQELSERTHGVWQASPGAVYPTLQQLEDEGLVRGDEREGKKVYALTDAGRAAIAEESGRPPWERFAADVDEPLLQLRDVAFQVGAAVMQVARAGGASDVAKTQEILEDTRRRIYQVLAEAEGSEPTPND